MTKTLIVAAFAVFAFNVQAASHAAAASAPMAKASAPMAKASAAKPAVKAASK
jgi:hypothetical protein